MIPALRRIAQHAAVYSRLRGIVLTQALTNALGEYDCDVDVPARRMTFSSPRGEVTATADLLGCVTVAPPAVVWGYSEHLADEVGPSPVAQHIARFGVLYSQPELAQDVLDYTVPDGAQAAEAAAGLGTEVFGPQALSWTVPRGESGAQQSFLLQAPSIEVPALTPELIAGHLPGLLSHDIDDPTWSLDGLRRLLPGWTVSADRHEAVTSYTVTDPHGTTATSEGA